MGNKRILENARIREEEDTWIAERWNGEDWEFVHASKTREKLVFWLDWMHPHPNIDTRATD